MRFPKQHSNTETKENKMKQDTNTVTRVGTPDPVSVTDLGRVT